MVKVVSAIALSGIDGIPVRVEASHANSAEPRTDLIGLPDVAVREALARVRAAARSLAFSIYGGVVTINLAPADVRKEGSAFDLPILLSIIDESVHGEIDFTGRCFAGELSLTGEVRPINGALSMAIAARQNGMKEIYLPAANAAEASAAEGIDVYPVGNVGALYRHLLGEAPIAPQRFSMEAFLASSAAFPLDYADVLGQEMAKKALEIAAAGMHNVLMIGPPGSGKSMLAGRLPSILPPLSVEEAIETTKIHSVAGILPAGTSLLDARPFRAPHHSLSAASLAGGGKVPRPGEISLAHNGVLFLDEFPEFDKTAMEILRQPLEERRINLTRVSGTVSYPCSFLLVCAMNPCRCGYFGHPTHPCKCSEQARHAYLARISGPLLDRMDIQIEVPPLEFSELSDARRATGSAEMRRRVADARAFAAARFGRADMANGLMDGKQIRQFCALDDSGTALLKQAFDRLSLSARSYDRILRVARTVADLDRSDDIKTTHLALALQLRCLDKKYFHF